MSVVLIPGAFRREAHPVGKLAATLLSVAVAGMADPNRFRRGKAYAGQRAVTRLTVQTGVCEAVVSGSRAEPYRVVVAVPTVTPPGDVTDPAGYRAEMTRLVPDASELMVSCTCPDWDDPCKHAIAALLTLAEELAGRPELIVAWRCAEGAPRRGRAALATAGRSVPGRPAPVPRPAPPAPAVDPFATDEWRAFEGLDSPIPSLPLPSLESVRRVSAIDVTGVEELVQSMLDTITAWR